VSVFDMTGHVVLTSTRVGLAPGRHTFVFHGRNAEGRVLASGIYTVKVVTGSSTALGKVVLLR
jgi:hypothetical protein